MFYLITEETAVVVNCQSVVRRQGKVKFKTPSVDLTQQLVELSEDVIEVEIIVALTCLCDRDWGDRYSLD